MCLHSWKKNRVFGLEVMMLIIFNRGGQVFFFFFFISSCPVLSTFFSLAFAHFVQSSWLQCKATNVTWRQLSTFSVFLTPNHRNKTHWNLQNSLVCCNLTKYPCCIGSKLVGGKIEVPNNYCETILFKSISKRDESAVITFHLHRHLSGATPEAFERKVEDSWTQGRGLGTVAGNTVTVFPAK